MNSTYRRLIAAFLTALIVFIILMSACAVVIETTHECSGSDCDICQIIGTILGVIRLFSTITAVIIVFVTADPQRIIRFFNSRNSVFVTPVTEKVRLLN